MPSPRIHGPHRPLASVALMGILLLLGTSPSQAALDLRNALRYQLDNGLTVILLEDRNFPVVSVQMLYRIGARNEVTGKTGLAHFLEHMAFRATKRFPDTEVVSRIYAAGGEWHGYTWTDQTTYFATVPKERLDLLLRIEAERMRHLEIDPAFIEAERGAVLTEMHMYETDPASLLLDTLLATSFLAHPYRNNTIGWESDVDSISHADVVAFYEAHYHPANAVLAVVGDFDAALTRKRIASLFGRYERRARTPLPHTLEPLQQGERRVGVSGTGPGRRFMVGYRAPAVTHPDYAGFLVLQEVLAGGSGVNFLQNDWGTPARETSLLHGAAEGVTSWFPPGAQDYLFVIGALPGDGQSEQDAEQAIEARVASLRDEPPPDDAMDDAVDAVLDELVYDVQTTEDAAHQLAFFEGLGAHDVLLTLEERVRRVSAADVSRLARDYLRPERRTIAWYRPGAVAGRSAGPALPPPAPAAPAAVDEVPVGAPLAGTLASGLPAIVIASDLSPTVSLKLVVPGNALSNAAFVAGDPEPGVLAWNGRTRPGDFAALVADAAAALGAARYVEHASEPAATDAETRLYEEFLELMQLEAAGADQPARPLVVVVAGDVDSEAAFATLEAHFGSVSPAVQADARRNAPPAGGRSITLGVPVAQAQLGYLVAAPAPTDPDYGAWRILQYIVAHDYEGRLGKAAISDRGLAYYVDARYTSAGGPGWTSLAIGVDAHKVEALKSLVAAEFARLASEPPSAAEVDEARRHLLGREVSAAQSNDELATRLARHWLQFGQLPSVAALRERLDAVTREDVLAIVPAFTKGVTITVSP